MLDSLFGLDDLLLNKIPFNSSLLKTSNLRYENKRNTTCSGRRGTKRKAEVQAEEEKPSVEQKKDKGEGENGQSGQRVVIEHW